MGIDFKKIHLFDRLAEPAENFFKVMHWFVGMFEYLECFNFFSNLYKFILNVMVFLLILIFWLKCQEIIRILWTDVQFVLASMQY